MLGLLGELCLLLVCIDFSGIPEPLTCNSTHFQICLCWQVISVHHEPLKYVNILFGDQVYPRANRKLFSIEIKKFKPLALCICNVLLGPALSTVRSMSIKGKKEPSDIVSISCVSTYVSMASETKVRLA